MVLHYTRNILVFLCATCFIQTSFSYIMPVCSENGGVCNEYGENCHRKAEESSPHLFWFVTQTMDISRKLIYESMFGVEIPKPVEIRKPSYLDLMWNFFGFAVETREAPPTGDSSNKYNFSFIGLVGASYFGYIFLATHYMNRKNEAEKKYFARKFNNYIASDRPNIFEDNMLLGDDSYDSISSRASRCRVCERHKLAMESPPENTKEIKAKQISSLPNFGVSTSNLM